MFSMERFSDWLLKELENRDMSQSDLARAAGLGRGTISNIMTGTRNVGQETLIKIAAALRLPPEFVFEKAGILPPSSGNLSPIKRALIHVAEELPDSDIELALTLLEKRLEFYKRNPQEKPSK